MEPVIVDLDRVDRSGGAGAVWSLPHGGDLDANLVRLGPGEAIGAHVNSEVDVLVVVVGGSGTVDIDGAIDDLRPSVVVLVPKGASRSITAGDGELVYLSAHRARGGLQIRTR
jgi:mannose-6-phosphate isomerase-like protein (cupin superfamily)